MHILEVGAYYAEQEFNGPHYGRNVDRKSTLKANKNVTNDFS